MKTGLQYVDTSLQQAFWTYSFPEGEKVQGDIYLYDNVLVVPSMAGQMPNNKNYLQGIDLLLCIFPFSGWSSIFENTL